MDIRRTSENDNWKHKSRAFFQRNFCETESLSTKEAVQAIGGKSFWHDLNKMGKDIAEASQNNTLD